MQSNVDFQAWKRKFVLRRSGVYIRAKDLDVGRAISINAFVLGESG